MKTHGTVILVAALTAALCASSTLTAAEVAPEDAMRAAAVWAATGRSMGGIPADRAVASVEALEDASTGARLLVAKFEGGGFVVMSADDLVDPVISFSATGDGVVADESSPYWALLRGDIAAREAAAGVVRGGVPPLRPRASTAQSAKTAAQRRWAELLDSAASESTSARPRAGTCVVSPSDIRVEPFVATRWNQSTHSNFADGRPCYNYYTPDGCVCGCVATAGAQIMRYWRRPVGSVAARTFQCKIGGTAADCTMKGGSYDWASMPPVPAEGVTEAQCQAIGKLTYDVGVSVGMNWSPGGSAAACYDLACRLPDTFGYANAVAAVYIDGHYDYSLEELKKVVVPNCDARAPVAMSISGAAGGHAVLVDGYGYSADVFCMHVNFGWGGLSDAWYSPPDIENFAAIDGFVFNVFPSEAGSILSGRVLDAGGGPVAGASVELRRSASAIVAGTTADANGTYAFIVPRGSYLVYARSGDASAVIDASVGTTVGTLLNGAGGYYLSKACIGNSYGNDITVSGLSGVEPPVFSPDSCTFYPSTNVAISCGTSGAVIRYTLDGTDPDVSSPLYTGPVFVDDDVTIRARAFAEGLNPSPAASATYAYDTSAGAPKGDSFGNPISISGADGRRVIADNSAYTTEEEEPWHTLENYSRYEQYRTVWYRWTAPGSGMMTFSTKCSGGVVIYPTFVAIYTGDTLASAERLAFSTAKDVNWETSLPVMVEQGATYRIVGMMGCDGSGAFTLSWSGDLTVSRSPYEAWADENGLGAPEAVTDGVANIFRYVFGIPAGEFSPISAVGRDESGRMVVVLPGIVNTDGVEMSVLSTTDIADWRPPAAEERIITVGADGTVTFDDASSGPRFYRLKAVVPSR